MTTLRRFFPLVAVASLAAPATAGELAPLELAKAPLDLLGGRMTMRFPAGARLEARRRSIMAAPESAQQESRVVLEKGGEKLVTMVYELFALAGPDFEKAVRKEVGGWKGKGGGAYTVAPLALGGKVKALAVTPPALDLAREAVLVRGLFVALPDGTAQYVGFFVNPAAGKDAAGCAALVRRIEATLAPGARSLGRAAGPRGLDFLAADEEVQVTVPEGWVASAQPGPDFIVHYLRKLVPYGTPGRSIGIYFGGHPQYQHLQTDGPPPKVTATKAKLLGKDVEWHAWARYPEPGSATTTEAIAPLPGHEQIRVHVFATTVEAAHLAEVRAILATLKVVKKTGK